MKLFKLRILLFLFTAFYSCNQIDRDTRDVVEGTPTNADTVLFGASPASSNIHSPDSAAKEKLPIVYWR